MQREGARSRVGRVGNGESQLDAAYHGAGRQAACDVEAEQGAMAAELGADTLFYLPLEAVSRCIGLDPSRLCRGCLTGKYPTETGERLYQLSLRQRNGSSNGRTYELPAIAASTGA